MKVLSLFDGISCAHIALNRAGIPVEAYYASEIDKYAMQISAKNWPEAMPVGSVLNVQGDRVYSVDGKSVGLSALGGGRGAKTGLYLVNQSRVRKLTPIECERLQSLPDGHTEGVSDSQRYKTLGNAFNAEVIAYILSHIPNE